MPDTHPQRDPEEDAAARRWARATRDSLEAGELSDDARAIAERLEMERHLKTGTK
jgi:hypothetical protein